MENEPSSEGDGSAFARVGLGRPLWPHQQRALAAFDSDRAAGRTSASWVNSLANTVNGMCQGRNARVIYGRVKNR